VDTAQLPAMPLSEHVVSDYQTVRLSLKAHPMSFLRERFAAKGFITADQLRTIRDGRRVSLAGLVLIRQRPGSAKGVCFITLEDETGIANLVVWPDVFEKQRTIVMGARLMVVHGVIQRDDQQPDCPQQSGTGHDIIHVVVRKLEDGTPMLRHLSDGLMPSTLNQGDAGGSWRPPASRHPRDVAVIPKSRDFH
jgi:error-prone DNA polymerase